MKKAIITLVVVLTIVMAAGCASKEQTPGADSKPVIRVATDATWPPFEMIDEETKEIIGFDIDMMKAVGEIEGFDIEFVNVAFDTVISGVAECQYDAAVSAITVTDERKDQMNFTDTYYTTGQILTVKEGNEANNTKESMEGKIIGAQTGTTGAIMAQEWEEEGLCTYKGYDSVDLAYLDLKNGQVDSVLADDVLAYAYAEKLSGIVPVGDLFSSEEYAVAVCKSKTDLLAQLNDGISKIKENGELDKINSKFFDNAAAE